MRTVFFAFTLFFASIMPALGSPLDLSYTHNTALTVPELSEPEASFKLAKTWFLPDWQAGLGSRTDTAPAGAGDLNGSDYTCEKTYNLNTSCTSPQTIEKTHNMGKITCYKCKCPDNYKTTSCKTGWHLSGTPCKIGTTSYYTGCAVDACPSGYTAGKTCGNGYTLEKSGQSGDQYCGKCVAKSCPSEYTAGLANCNGKTYPAGWTYSSNGYSGDSICGKCTAKTCSSGTAGLANCNGKAQPSGWTYSSNGYAGDSVCGTCTAKSCPAGYTAGVTQCSNTTSWTYGSNGYAGDSICGKCTEKGCADGYTKGLSNCNGKTHPAGWTYSPGTPSGSTVCGKCTAKTCSEGSTSCDTATQNATANGYYAGDSTCYTCTAKTCEQLGKKTCNGSCIATSECCNCTSSQKCVNGSCVAKTCADAGGPSCADGQKCENGSCVTTSTSTKCAATLRAQGAQVAETAEELLAISQNLDLFTGSNVIPIFIIGDISVDTLEIYFPRLNLYDGYYAVESGICSLDGETQENKTKLLTSKLIVTNEMYLGPDTVNIFLNNYDINSLFAESSGLFGSLKFYATDSVNSGKIGKLDAGFTSVDFGKNEVSNLEDPTSGLVNLYAPNIDIENLTTNQGVNFNTAYVTINNFNHSGNIIFNSGYVTIDTMTATYLNEILFNAGNSSNRMDIKNLTVEKTSTMVWVLQDATMNIEDFLLKSGNLTIRLNGNSKMFFFNIASLKSNNSTIDTLMTNAYDNNYLYDYSSKYTGSGAHVAQPNFTYSMILGNKNCIGTPQNSTCTTSKLGSIDYNANRILSFSFNEKNKYGSSCSTWNMGTPLTPNYSIDDGVTQTDTSGCISYSFSLN